jgi:hypothetical protein
MGQAFSFQRDPHKPLDASAMAERVMRFAPATDAEALKLLRASYPECSLSMRVAALDMLMRRRSMATRLSA